MADLINVYDALGIDPTETTDGIRDGLARRKARFATRRQREDDAGVEARRMYDAIEQVEPCFTDDSARDAYDKSLRETPASQDRAVPNWLSLAWSYYAQEDFGPAEVAARHAREVDRENPDAWVVSAWIELAPITRHTLLSDESWDEVLARFQRENRAAEHDPRSALTALVQAAKKYADEAYTPFGSASAGDVAHVRGVCFYFLGDFPRSVQSFKAALGVIENTEERAELHLRMGLAMEAAHNLSDALSACESSLVTDNAVPHGLTSAAENIWSRVAIDLCEQAPLEDRSPAYAEFRRRIEVSQVNAQSRVLLADNCEANRQRLEALDSAQRAAAAASQRLAVAQKSLEALRSRKSELQIALSAKYAKTGNYSAPASVEGIKSTRAQLSTVDAPDLLPGGVLTIILGVVCVVSGVIFFSSFPLGNADLFSPTFLPIAIAGVTGWCAWVVFDKHRQDWVFNRRKYKNAQAGIAVLSAVESDFVRLENDIAALEKTSADEQSKSQQPSYPPPIHLAHARIIQSKQMPGVLYQPTPSVSRTANERAHE